MWSAGRRSYICKRVWCLKAAGILGGKHQTARCVDMEMDRYTGAVPSYRHWDLDMRKARKGEREKEQRRSEPLSDRVGAIVFLCGVAATYLGLNR